jgi:hypothetical protein
MSCAALGFSTDALTAAASVAVLQGLQQQRYSPRQVAASAFALAKLQACPPEVTAEVADAFLQQAQRYTPDALSMLCWACVLGDGQTTQPAFWAQLLQRSGEQLAAFSADQVGCLGANAACSLDFGCMLQPLTAAGLRLLLPLRMQLASLLRGVCSAPGWQGDEAAVVLVSDAAALLQPSKLQGMSTPVLAALIRSLAQQGKRYVAPADTQQPGDSSGTLATLLSGTVSAWLQPGRRQHISHAQAQAVQAALAACGQQQLATAAQQVGSVMGSHSLGVTHNGLTTQHAPMLQVADDVQARAAATPEPALSPAQQQTGVPAAAVHDSSSRAPGSWVDSFVATGT